MKLVHLINKIRYRKQDISHVLNKSIYNILKDIDTKYNISSIKQSRIHVAITDLIFYKMFMSTGLHGLIEVDLGFKRK